MIPVGEPLKYMKLDFFSQDYFQKWLKVIKSEPEFKKLKEWLNKEDSILTELIDENQGIKDALDVGCGWGRHLEIMLKKGVNKVAGVDKSPLMVEKAMRFYKTYGDERVMIKLEDGQDMSFKDNRFDLVICMTNTFGNLRESNTKMRVLDEMIRVVKPGGRIIISVYRDSPSALEIRKNSYIKVNLHPYIAEDKKTIFVKEGLVSEQFKEEEIVAWLAKKNLTSKSIPINDLAFIVTALKQ